ncbi:DUF7310 family coiled-coil domain-containing protein [Natrinema longum]|uniref:DUF7310 domain-containing protein n=1 Tax=Natrinema longum TaxID=370324 RepID=A0A8A2U8M1_9EURY|nr:hypothetical protein [Natrinema longum]MBZ6493607.1 hypothetical protein [Natrinema longum]QSW85050.1 hypothetical protein J0X27_16630 [Natrinema longum]
MTDIERLEQRLSAVERVVVDGDVTFAELSELTSLAETVAELETRLEEQDRRIADLEATVQSIEGYVGNVESINDDVERHAASAVATVDRFERRMDKLEVELDDLQGGLLDTEPEAPERDEDVTDGTATETTNADGEPTVFTFGESGLEEPDDAEGEPERSVEGIVDGTGTSRSIVDDGADRPASSANQSTVDSALGESDSATNGPATDEDDGGLVGSLRSRLL